MTSLRQSLPCCQHVDRYAYVPPFCHGIHPLRECPSPTDSGRNRMMPLDGHAAHDKQLWNIAHGDHSLSAGSQTS